MLSLQRVTLESARYRWYGARRWSPLLQNVSFDIAPGEMVALVGGSGEGKSLLLQCLLDLLPENLRFRGEITLDGNRLDRHTIRQLRGNTFSYVPQGVQALNPMLNIRKHLNRACHLTGRAGMRRRWYSYYSKAILHRQSGTLSPPALRWDG